MAENIENKGLKYFKLDKKKYPGDETVNRGLAGVEIDNNFFFLRGKDINDIHIEKKLVENKERSFLIVNKLDGETIELDLSEFARKNDVDNEIGKLKINDVALKGEIMIESSMERKSSKGEISIDKIEEIKDGKVVGKKLDLNLGNDLMFICGE